MHRKPMRKTTSWDKDHSWYDSLTRGRGQYFHEHVILPNVRRLMELSPGARVLEFGCGSGVLGRSLKKSILYTGIDLSPKLIDSAKRQDRNNAHDYRIADVTKPIKLDQQYDRAAIILAIQNIQNPDAALKNLQENLEENSICVLVMNHPCFRIPRQSSWGVDEKNGIQYRRVNRYLTPLEIPITMHPGQSSSTVTWSYHLPLSAYSALLAKHGFLIESIEEWSSDKRSQGKTAKMENRSRAEIPLFLAIKAVKITRPRQS